ncbi:MAG TPA: TonB-dependent receptor plug domain-containing protein, partial [Pseudomonadota bacterium]|nr:TonB-dependent receptor plug domain-containing protein [Pseudomonadota bacterium]
MARRTLHPGLSLWSWVTRRLALPALLAGLWSTPLHAESDPGVGDAKKAAPPARSVTDPGYDVLLPDPEPPSESSSKAGQTNEQAGDLDIADRVLSAAKSVTTVAEAPSIITVVRADEIQARGYRTLTQLLETIPGWHTTTNGGTLFPFSLVRGTGQASLLLRDGVSMFDPALNLTQLGRVIPLETLKVVEVVNGPGGVLWGANSFLGIINLVSKDADDINGVEMGMGGGHGDGTREDFRAWVLFGKSFRPKRGPKISIVQHFSAETWLPPSLPGLLTVTRSAAPSPPGPQVWSDFSSSNPARAWLVNLSGKVSIGPITLYYAAPFGEQNSSLSTGNNLAVGAFDASTGMSVTTPQRNLVNGFERFVTAQYKDRFLRDRLGLDAKLYGVQFRREIDFVIVPGTRLNAPGLSLRTPVESYRVGFSVDGDAALPARNKL